MTDDTDYFRIVESGKQVNAVELELHLHFGLWAVVDRTDERWLVRTRDGERLTLRPVES